jgi:hypothetical protein
MTPDASYLFGRVGSFGLLVPAAMVTHVFAENTIDAPAPTDAGAAIDLRALFCLDASQSGPHITLRTDAGVAVVVVDHVASLHRLTDADFRPLPAAFDYARTVFDAVCRRPIEGILALRLRRDPRFVAMAEWRPGSDIGTTLADIP